MMLILLGVQTLLILRRRKVHIHSHHHFSGELEPHRHFHSHEMGDEHVHHSLNRWENVAKLLIAGVTPGEHQAESTMRTMKPFFRLKSYMVGTVHGLAGSAALMLLVLASMRSTWDGVMYILVFGFGTAVSMGVISIFISLPFSISSRIPQLNRVIQAVAGAFSIVFGLVLMYRIGIVEGLLTGI